MTNSKSQPPKARIALNLMVRGTDSEAELVARLLGNCAQFFDGVFVTTEEIEGQNKIKEVCSVFGATLAYYKWDNNFANARNFALSQIPKSYTHWMWLDADDMLRGGEKIQETIEQNPTIDAFGMFYLYAFDEWKNPTVVHQKSRIFKNDGCVRWVGALHEDFHPTRELNTKLIKGIEVLHMTDEKRVEMAKERNLRVAEIDQTANPKDPRSYWNLGNALKSVGKNEEAIKAFETFLELSQSDDEKYITRLRMAEAYWGLEKKSQAIDCARYAVGIKPYFPDAYHLLGNLYFASNRFGEAKESYMMGLTMKPPYYSIIVYNPRDYDYVPLMNLAKTYFNLSLPSQALTCLKACEKIYPKDKGLKKTIKMMEKESNKFEEVAKLAVKLEKIKDDEKLKAELDKIPVELASHPAICQIRNKRFIKTTSTGRDLVYFCGITSEEWDPEIANKRGVGGSEEAVIHLSELLAEKGWNVTVYNNCGSHEKKFGKVTYKPYWTWNSRDKQDVTIFWRTPRYLDYGVNSERLFVDLHDVVKDGEFTPNRLEKIDKVFVKSNAHRKLFPSIPDEKIAVIPNGIDVKAFSGECKRDQYLILNTSSPDRSITALIDCFREVKKQVPQAKLKWTYGWSNWDYSNADNAKMAEWKSDVLKKIAETEGMEALGRVPKEEVIKLYKEANVLGYPSEFYEIDCISVSKAQAVGAYPVTTDFAAMGDKRANGGVFIHSEKTTENWCGPYQFDFSIENIAQKEAWVKQVVRLLNNPPSEEERNIMREQALRDYNWNTISEKWDNVLNNGKI